MHEHLTLFQKTCKNEASEPLGEAEVRVLLDENVLERLFVPNVFGLAHCGAAEPGAEPRRAKPKDEIASARTTPGTYFSTFFAPFRRAARA